MNHIPSPARIVISTQMTVIPSSAFRTIKNGSYHNGISGPSGYLLAGTHSVARDSVSYTFPILPDERFSFVFGFNGVGRHYTCHINPPDGVIAIYEVRDGIRIYLHHVRVAIPSGSHVCIVWDSVSIRLRLNNFTLLQVLAQGPDSGHWGFAPLGRRFRVPDVSVQVRVPWDFQWICLGDGFSNARWKTRDFLSWPELVFGEADICLNACVGACNTKRAIEVVHQIRSTIENANIILSVGADDLIEGESIDDFASRLQSILSSLRAANASRVLLATLHPRASALAETWRWSEKIREVAERYQVGILDFHQWLAPDIQKYMVSGEYPGRAAQELIADRVASELGILKTLTAPSPFGSTQESSRIWHRLLRRVQSEMKRQTREYPGAVD